MLQFYGTQPPASLNALRCGGTCPHCGRVANFTRMVDLMENVAKSWKVAQIIVTYHCDACLRPVPVLYDVIDWDPTRVKNARIAVPVVEPFDFDHVPASVDAVVREALACLSAGAPNGFAALCRRASEVIGDDLGDGATRVQSHVQDMVRSSGLDAHWERLALLTFASPGEGEREPLPSVDEEQARVLLSLLRDLVYQFYTRPGSVRSAAAARSPSSVG
jgi:hypothetical protein